jgi:hypothetical protein
MHGAYPFQTDEPNAGDHDPGVYRLDAANAGLLLLRERGAETEPFGPG